MYDVPCIFQIWKRNNDGTLRTYEKLHPIGYSFVKKEEFHHAAFRRVGGKSGQITIDTDECNVNCYYFIRFDSDIDLSIVERLRRVSFDERDDTVGPRSISKRELIRKYNQILGRVNDN